MYLDNRLDFLRLTNARQRLMCTENAARGSRVAFKGGKFVYGAVGSRRRLAAAYKVDDFVAVAGLNGSTGPLWTREDFEVAFDRDSGGGKVQVAK
jgi:hypothetical protein